MSDDQLRTFLARIKALNLTEVVLLALLVIGHGVIDCG